MDDHFMYGLRQTPPTELVVRLRDRLRDQQPSRRPSKTHSIWPRLVVGAATAAALLLSFIFPGVRTSAQAFFDLFRVVNFTAVPFDTARLERLGPAGLDLRTLIGQQTRVISNPGPPQVFVSIDDAGRAAGFLVKEPTALPPDMVRINLTVEGEQVVQVIADGQRLADVLQALGITDLHVPNGFDGQTAVIRISPVVAIEYTVGNQTLTFVQSRSPEITAPTGLDLPRLGELGLRIAGVERRQAHTLAQAIDWRNTLVVPVPAESSTFRQVDVRGRRGLLIETSGSTPLRTLMWSDGTAVYGLTGNMVPDILILAAGLVLVTR